MHLAKFIFDKNGHFWLYVGKILRRLRTLNGHNSLNFWATTKLKPFLKFSWALVSLLSAFRGYNITWKCVEVKTWEMSKIYDLIRISDMCQEEGWPPWEQGSLAKKRGAIKSSNKFNVSKLLSILLVFYHDFWLLLKW